MIRAGTVAGRLFPAPLYASVVVALLCLVRPEPARAVESVLSTLASLPVRAGLLVLGGVDAVAPGDRELVAGHVRRVTAEFESRLRTSARRRPDGIADDLRPAWVPVVARETWRGARPEVLVLAASIDELADCERFVTVGDALAGFLLVASDVEDGTPRLTDAGRVSLLHHRPARGVPRRVSASIALQDQRELRFLVEPAESLDVWPLRCALLDDPYMAGRLADPELTVRTTGLLDDPLGALPAGLVIGSMRVFGYRTRDGDGVLPIGLFVAPRAVGSAISHVVVWRRGGAVRDRHLPIDAVDRIDVHLSRVPARGGELRWVAVTTEPFRALPRDSVVLDGNRLIGDLEAVGAGFGTMAPFGEAGRTWHLTCLPDDGGPPIDFVAQTMQRAGDLVRAAVIEPEAIRITPGELFTGAGGTTAPAGAWVGRVDVADAEVLQIRVVAEVPGQVAVVADPAEVDG